MEQNAHTTKHDTSHLNDLAVQKLTLLRVIPPVEPDKHSYPCDTNATCTGHACTSSGASC